jgi:hypothetical protein
VHGRLRRPNTRLEGYGKSLFLARIVIPAEAGIQYFQCFLDSRLRGSDGSVEFFRILLEKAGPRVAAQLRPRQGHLKVVSPQELTIFNQAIFG